MFVFFIGKYSEKWDLKRRLDLRPSDTNYLEIANLVDVVAKRHDLRTVGELYEFLCEKGLPDFADSL